jgi:hypothetical protein
MLIVKRAGNEQSFDQLKMRQYITNMVNIYPKLYSIDVSKTVKSIQKGLSDKMSSDEILNYVTEHCASLGSHTHDYSILAGRVAEHFFADEEEMFFLLGI